MEWLYRNRRAEAVEFVGVQVLGMDPSEDGQRFISELGLTFALGPDEDDVIVSGWNVRHLPPMLFVDANRRIVCDGWVR